MGYEIATNMTTGGIRNLTAPTDIRELTEVVCQEAERVLNYWGKDIEFCDEDMSYSGKGQIKIPELNFLKDYAPDSLVYVYGGIRETLQYDKDAAIIGGRASKITVKLKNLHPVEKRMDIQLELPEGFYLKGEGTKQLILKPEGDTQIVYEICADAAQIRDTNQCWLKMKVCGEPALPAIPVGLLGGNRWMISRLYPDKTIEDDCCVDEQSWFVRPPEQFEEQWNVGNDLCLGTRFSEKGVIFALHQFYSDEDREVVLGVPNNGYMKLYLNTKLIHTTKEKTSLRANLGNGGALGDLSNYKVTTIAKGWNQVLIKLQADELPQESHFTIGGMSKVCVKNHGMPVLGLCRSRFLWEIS